jgi:hypothetical protein
MLVKLAKQTVVHETEPKMAVFKGSDGLTHVYPIESGEIYVFEDTERVELFPRTGKAEPNRHKTPPEGYPKDRSEYADPDDYLFPLDTEKRVRSALSYFDKHKWASEEKKKRAAKRILSRAKKYEINVDTDSKVYHAAKD